MIKVSYMSTSFACGGVTEITFVNEKITLTIRFFEMPNYQMWTSFNEAIDNGVPSDIYIDDIGSFHHENHELVFSSKGIKIHISLSNENRHILKQLEEVNRCFENEIEYVWSDPPTEIKSARKK